MKCANCGSDMRYDVSVMGLVCDYCGAVKNLPKPEDEQLIGDMDFGTAIRGAATDWGVSRRPVECKSCGAQMFYSPDQMSGICPYCGSFVVVSGEEADLGMAPNAIIPFSMTREEIAAALSGRRMEQNIMKIMPFGILAYVGMSSPGYFDPLYGNITGTAIMTGLMILYLSAFYLGDRILGKLEEGA